MTVGDNCIIVRALSFYLGFKAMYKYPVYITFMFKNFTYVVLSRT